MHTIERAARVFRNHVTFPDRCPECKSKDVEPNTDCPTDPELVMLCTACDHTWEPNA